MGTTSYFRPYQTAMLICRKFLSWHLFNKFPSSTFFYVLLNLLRPWLLNWLYPLLPIYSILYIIIISPLSFLCSSVKGLNFCSLVSNVCGRERKRERSYVHLHLLYSVHMHLKLYMLFYSVCQISLYLFQRIWRGKMHWWTSLRNRCHGRGLATVQLASTLASLCGQAEMGTGKPGTIRWVLGTVRKG